MNRIMPSRVNVRSCTASSLVLECITGEPELRRRKGCVCLGLLRQRRLCLLRLYLLRLCLLLLIFEDRLRHRVNGGHAQEHLEDGLRSGQAPDARLVVLRDFQDQRPRQLLRDNRVWVLPMFFLTFFNFWLIVGKL